MSIEDKLIKINNKINEIETIRQANYYTRNDQLKFEKQLDKLYYERDVLKGSLTDNSIMGELYNNKTTTEMLLSIIFMVIIFLSFFMSILLS